MQETKVVPRRQASFHAVRSSLHQQEFQDRFKGRATLISKEGHAGVVQNTQKPIEKGDRTQRNSHAMVSEALSNSGRSQLNPSYQSPDGRRPDLLQLLPIQPGFRNEDSRVSMSWQSPTKEGHHYGDSSPLLRVGTTITASTNMSTLSQNEIISAAALHARFEALRSSIPQGAGGYAGSPDKLYSAGGYQGAASCIDSFGGGFALPSLNGPLRGHSNGGSSMAGSSFYSAMPLAQASGYSGSFGQIRPNPMMDQQAYGSHSSSFPRLQPTFYSEQQMYPVNAGQYMQVIPTTYRGYEPLTQRSMQPAVNGISKYQQFANQASRMKVEAINQGNYAGQENTYETPSKREVYPSQTEIKAPRREIRITRSIEFTNVKPPQQRSNPTLS